MASAVVLAQTIGRSLDFSARSQVAQTPQFSSPFLITNINPRDSGKT